MGDGSSGVRGSRHSVVTVVALLVLLSATGARAQTDEERAGARSLANQAADAYDAGRFQDAVDLFKRAESLVHSPVHWLYTARGLAKLGRFVEAREYYLKTTREVLPGTAPQAFHQAKTDAEKELAPVEARLAYVTVELKGVDRARARVTVDGEELASALVGVEHPIDPGEHTFAGSAEGFTSAPLSVTLAERARQAVTLEFTPLAAATPAAAAPLPTRDQAPLDEQGTGGGSPGLRLGSYIGFGVGAVGLGAGTFFLLKANGKSGEADDLCNLPGGECPVSQRDKIEALDDDAVKARRFALGGFILGGAGVATGVTLFLLSRGSSGESESGRRPAFEPVVGLGALGVRGTF